MSTPVTSFSQSPSLPSQPPVNFTESAARKVKSLIDEEGNLSVKLRVSIKGGGCSGFQYVFTFDEKVDSTDWIITQHIDAAPVDLLIDSLSFSYLKGAEIDYREDINGAQFVIRNPNAKTTCGCGSSFGADVDPADAG
jgi:iron-sulfur cluster insertion protein